MTEKEGVLVCGHLLPCPVSQGAAQVYGSLVYLDKNLVVKEQIYLLKMLMRSCDLRLWFPVNRLSPRSPAGPPRGVPLCLCPTASWQVVPDCP